MRKISLIIILIITAVCFGVKIESGDVSRSVYFVAVDSTDYITRETSLTSAACYYSVDGGAAAAMTTPTITAVDDVNMPGVFKLAIDESGMVTLSAGVEFAELVVHITATEMAPVTMSIDIFDGFTTEVAAILADTNDLQTSQGDWATATGFSTHSASDVVDNFETQSQADPTGFHVNVLEIGGTSQTANDNGADINAILTDTEIISDVNSNITEDIAAIALETAEIDDVNTNILAEITDSNSYVAGLISGSGSDAALIADVNSNIMAAIDDANDNVFDDVAAIYAIVNHASYGNAQLVRSETPENTLGVDETHIVSTSKTGYILASNGLDSISTTEPTGRPSDFREWLIWLCARYGNKTTMEISGNTGTLTVYKDNETTAMTEQVISETSSTQTVNEATTPSE